MTTKQQDFSRLEMLRVETIVLAETYRRAPHLSPSPARLKLRKLQEEISALKLSHPALITQHSVLAWVDDWVGD